MRTVEQPDGRLHKTSEGITLLSTPQSKRLTENLHDLIMLAYQQSTNRPGNSLSLIRLEYASGERQGEKFYMHLKGRVRDHVANEIIPINLTFIADIPVQEYETCLAPF